MDMVRDCMREQTPFGVCLITQGAETGKAAQTEAVGTLAHISDWDMQQLGVLNIRCRGGSASACWNAASSRTDWRAPRSSCSIPTRTAAGARTCRLCGTAAPDHRRSARAGGAAGRRRQRRQRGLAVRAAVSARLQHLGRQPHLRGAAGAAEGQAEADGTRRRPHPAGDHHAVPEAACGAEVGTSRVRVRDASRRTCTRSELAWRPVAAASATQGHFARRAQRKTDQAPALRSGRALRRMEMHARVVPVHRLAARRGAEVSFPRRRESSVVRGQRTPAPIGRCRVSAAWVRRADQLRGSIAGGMPAAGGGSRRAQNSVTSTCTVTASGAASSAAVRANVEGIRFAFMSILGLRLRWMSACDGHTRRKVPRVPGRACEVAGFQRLQIRPKMPSARSGLSDWTGVRAARCSCPGVHRLWQTM